MFNSPSFLLPPLEMGSGGDTMRHPYHENYQIETEESRGVFRTQSNIKQFFAKIFNTFQPLNIFAKSSILDVCQDSECSSANGIKILKSNNKFS